MPEMICADTELLRREFDLPPNDVAFLDSLALPWEAVAPNGKQWVLIQEFPLPDGYNHRTVSARLCPF